MNIRQHQEALLGFVSRYAISIALAYPDATRVKLRDEKVVRWAGHAGTVFGWGLGLVIGAGFGVLMALFLRWALGHG